jgi:hypothetical protein
MLANRDEVLKALHEIRPDAGDYYIPLGARDEGTQAKREISNQTETLYRRLPLIRSMVAAAKAAKWPFYVGYDGRDEGDGHFGVYKDNVISLHQDADDEPACFIQAYCHELTHLDQDRRGLLNQRLQPPGPDGLGNYLVHNLCLEAAAAATEAACLYYLSNHCGSLLKKVPEVEDFFPEYIERAEDGALIQDAIESALEEGGDIEDFHDMKRLWQALFLNFFHPDSKRMSYYVQRFCKDYARQAPGSDNPSDASDWGGIEKLQLITTLPGWGPLFDPSSLPVLHRSIQSGIFQQKNAGMIDMARHIGEGDSAVIMNLIKGLEP